MADLKSLLSSFGLPQYYGSFVEAGFDSWETILDITESDLDCLDVQRGHRRRLQQEIAHTLNSRSVAHRQQSDAIHRSLPVDAKRQYTHHPKPDPNAPQRPLSAYVLFSNNVRAELKDQSLSFADKSKIVGDRWKNMSDSARDSWKQATNGPWDKYKADKLKYRDSDPYRQYQAYLVEFNGLQSSKKRKVLSHDFLHEMDEVQTRHTSSTDLHQTNANKRIGPTPGLAPPPESAAVSPSTSTTDRQRSLKSDFGGSKSSAQSIQASSSQRYGTACESCKKKKIKCDGGLPSCESCRKSSQSCFYAGGIRDREKRLLVSVVDKLDVWEGTLRQIQPNLAESDQSEIRRLLHMSPQAEEAKRMSSGLASGTAPDEAKEDSSDDPRGEDDASNVGSMGSTDHLNEESFAGDTGGGRIEAFLGQTATDNWVERIEHNLKISDADEPSKGSGDHRPFSRRDKDEIPITAADTSQTSCVDSSMFQEQCEPYELPLKASADCFIAAYFATVHPFFPILSRSQFLWNCETFFASPEAGNSSASMFVPMLHIVLAIGAVHAYVTQAPWARDEGFRLLRFARAKATILDACILGASAYEQIQLCGLGGLYMLIMYDINK
ncbi:MAG: hypothetical protein Q9171_000530 [Xanthocarpia ochracea]